MPLKQAGTLDAKVATARAVADCLVSIASGFESDEWMEKFRSVKTALDEGRLRDAIREECKLTSSWTRAKWKVSGELALTLEDAMGVLSRHVYYPNHSEPTLELRDLPNDVTVSGKTGGYHVLGVSGELLITNCRFRFSFQCPKTWEQLVPTEDASIRHCERCDKDVFLCRSEAEWHEHSRAGHCVALEEFERRDIRMTLGLPSRMNEPD